MVFSVAQLSTSQNRRMTYNLEHISFEAAVVLVYHVRWPNGYGSKLSTPMIGWFTIKIDVHKSVIHQVFNFDRPNKWKNECSIRRPKNYQPTSLFWESSPVTWLIPGSGWGFPQVREVYGRCFGASWFGEWPEKRYGNVPCHVRNVYIPTFGRCLGGQ